MRVYVRLMVFAGCLIPAVPHIASGQAPTFTVTALPETSGTYPAGTTFNSSPLTSETADPTGPFQHQSVWFRGFQMGGSAETNADGGHLVYRVQIQFSQNVSVNSITVTGFGDFVSCGAGPVLRLLDQTEAVIGSLSTAGLPSGALTTYSLHLTGAAGSTFFIDEFDCSTNGRYRDHIDLTFTTGCQTTITAVHMADNHTLQIDETGTFSDNPISSKTVAYSTTLGGVYLTDVFTFSAGATGRQSTSFLVDLDGRGVPRFVANERFAVTATIHEGGTSCDAGPQQAIILLPVVVVPGVQNPFGLHPDGGDGTFPMLEDTLRDHLLVGSASVDTQNRPLMDS